MTCLCEAHVNNHISTLFKGTVKQYRRNKQEQGWWGRRTRREGRVPCHRLPEAGWFTSLFPRIRRGAPMTERWAQYLCMASLSMISSYSCHERHEIPRLRQERTFRLIHHVSKLNDRRPFAGFVERKTPGRRRDATSVNRWHPANMGFIVGIESHHLRIALTISAIPNGSFFLLALVPIPPLRFKLPTHCVPCHQPLHFIMTTAMHRAFSLLPRNHLVPSQGLLSGHLP